MWSRSHRICSTSPQLQGWHKATVQALSCGFQAHVCVALFIPHLWTSAFKTAAPRGTCGNEVELVPYILLTQEPAKVRSFVLQACVACLGGSAHMSELDAQDDLQEVQNRYIARLPPNLGLHALGHELQLPENSKHVVAIATTCS